jgi:hypothetical protein
MGAENDLQIVLNFCTDPIEIEIESEQKSECDCRSLSAPNTIKAFYTQFTF